MTSNKSYEDDIKLSPFLADRSKTTYINAMKKMLEITNAPTIHTLLHSPQRYGPDLEKKASTEEVYRTYMITVLAFMKYSELKSTNHQLFTQWYTFFLRSRKKINRRLFAHEPTAKQKQAHVPWPVVLQKYKELTPGTKEHVLMSLITLLPPRRQTDWYQVKVYNSPDRSFKPASDHNYINLNYTEPYILLTDYKTHKFYGNWYKKVPATLLRILKEYVAEKPSRWLFVDGTSGAPYKLEAFTKWSNRVLKRVTGNEFTSMNAMRHAFVSYTREKEPNMSLKDQLTISKDMGHSIVQNMGYKLNN